MWLRWLRSTRTRRGTWSFLGHLLPSCPLPPNLALILSSTVAAALWGVPTCHALGLAPGDACVASAAMSWHPWTALASSRLQTGHGMSRNHCAVGRAPGGQRDSALGVLRENQGAVSDSQQSLGRLGSGSQSRRWVRLKGYTAQAGKTQPVSSLNARSG